MENMEDDAPGGFIDVRALGALNKEYLKRRQEMEQQEGNCNRLRNDLEFLNRLIIDLDDLKGGKPALQSLQGAIASQLLEIEREANRKKREVLQAQQATLQEDLTESLRRLAELREGFNWASTYEMMQKSWEALKVNADYRNFYRGWRELEGVATAVARTAPRDSVGARDGGSTMTQPVEPGLQRHRAVTSSPPAAGASVSSRQAPSARPQPEGPEPLRPKRARKYRDLYTPPGDDVPQHLTGARRRLSAAAGASKSNLSAPASPEGAPEAGLPGPRTRSSSPASSRDGPPEDVNHMAETSSQKKAGSKGKGKSDAAERDEKGPSSKHAACNVVVMTQ